MSPPCQFHNTSFIYLKPKFCPFQPLHILFNSCERLLLGTFISGQLHWNRKPQIGTNSLTLSTTITENGLRHASDPVHAKHPICYMYCLFFEDATASVKWTIKISFNKKKFKA